MVRRIGTRLLPGLVGLSFLGPLLAVAQKSAPRRQPYLQDMLLANKPGDHPFFHLYGFLPRLGYFAECPAVVPVDYAEMISCIAPRPVLFLREIIRLTAPLPAARVPFYQESIAITHDQSTTYYLWTRDRGPGSMV